jgi:hypothetical protein
MEPCEGMCVGGPLHGQPACSRFGKGFLLVDKVAGRCWLYDWREAEGTFVVREQAGAPLHDDGPDNRFRAAEETDFDVLAAPWIGGDELWPPPPQT